MKSLDWANNVISHSFLELDNIHPSKKVTQHDFDRLYIFYPGFLFIKFDIPRKPVYCLLIDALFVRVVSLGRMQGE